MFFLNNRYVFFDLSLRGFVLCDQIEGADKLSGLECYSNRDLETVKKWGGYWLYDSETREFKRLFAYLEDEVNKLIK